MHEDAMDDVIACLGRFETVRTASTQLCQHLPIEDYGLQAIAETSPLKWHLAHTSWFFETFILIPFAPDYQSPDPRYATLFNSYYNGIGEQFPRSQRHLLSRPTVAQVLAYRQHVDDGIQRLLTRHSVSSEVLQRLELGMHHEQQHQELMLTDLKYNLALNPLAPSYAVNTLPPLPPAQDWKWHEYDGGIERIGAGNHGFAFDNEQPQHDVLLAPFALSNRLINNGEYREFIADGGYRRPELWLSDGWNWVRQEGIQHPLYWQKEGESGQYSEFTLHGRSPLDPASPVTHLNYYEADAFARWAGARLPLESEWEVAARQQPLTGRFADSDILHPGPSQETPLQQLFGHCWEWTQSPYQPYPGFRANDGALGEYNGKFMCNQFVLRGGSCVTPPAHIRATYRNFFYPHHRWQFTGIRLARSPMDQSE